MVLSAWLEHETALDVVAYAAQIAAQLGANIVKVKLPSSHLEQPEAKKSYESNHVPLEKPEIAYVMWSKAASTGDAS